MQNKKWIPLIASIGVGAAAYYTMKRNNQNFGQTVQKMLPFMANLGGNNQQQSM
ncbi:hypothetical protein GCM10010978_29080 [Compostibacillus humi]|jgi:hypothetical protein|uniref:DUF3918 domain-containing protein n=1 Tax=Compostibacillus humi TaxID=1245525 RepID=A0A8J2TQ56_9BACI|nr:hypothetical protein [Compostibacillus humi]GFZ87427.1 hypothetical protein GCM10010978_29080 [Compostibacillus humi]HLT55165.1 hypothetical protein [Bacillota bacterium]